MNTKIVKISFVITMLIIALTVLCGSSIAYAETVMIGGKPVGITVGAKGLVVIETTKVITDEGAKDPCGGKLLKGDILKSVNGKEVYTVSDLRKSVKEEKCFVTVERKGETLNFELIPALEALTKEYKLGLYVKEEVSGIGTISFVKKDGTYGALGHRISDPETGLTFEYQTGNIYDAEVSGAKMGDKSAPGELKGRFNKADKIGTVEKNTPFGIYGKIDSYDAKTFETASIDEVKIGKAQIYTTVKGGKPEFYDVNVLRTFKQSDISEKGMIIQVTDKDLLAKTGGIVQGMSGSPIVQNGKIIGAVTHVFNGDYTKGYAIYIPWMLKSAA